MRTRYFVSGLLAAALLSSTAIAQTSSTNPPPIAKSEAAAPKLSSPHWRSSKMIGLDVYNDQNDKLGDINDIILDKDGKVLGYVIGVGGFLGMGEHDILVEPSKIKFVNEPARTASNTTKNPPANTTATNTNPPTTTGTPTNTKNVSNRTGSTRSASEQWYPDHGILNATKDQLKAMPQFKYSNYKS
jgi:sporulation protein YlmC with PRC-barrel domain